jgi:hypothetical protein
MQKNGAGMITATSCFWDRDSDGISDSPTSYFVDVRIGVRNIDTV